MKRLMLTLLIALFGMSLAACNTIRGAGEDIERGGEEIQEASEEVGDEIDEELD